MNATAATDPAQTVIDFLFERMQIDLQWAVRGDREFAWWPHDLRQRVWASSIEEHEGVRLCHLHVETDLVAGARDDRDSVETVIWMNRSAMLSALVLHAGHIRLHASVAVNAGNLPFASELALHAMALQLVESSFAADTLVSKGCGARDSSAHPASGPRTEPDQMLGIGGLYADPDHTVPEIDFGRLSQSPERCWLEAMGEANSFTAAFAVDTGTSGVVDMVKQQEGLGTALFQATTAESHPAIGSGLLTALRMPDVPLDGRRAANTLNTLNLGGDAARHAGGTVSPAHALGSWWYSDQYGVTFSTFYPALVFRKDKPEWNYRLFESLVWHTATTAGWARALLARDRRAE